MLDIEAQLHKVHTAHWAVWASGPIGTLHDWQIYTCKSINIEGLCNVPVLYLSRETICNGLLNRVPVSRMDGKLEAFKNISNAT